MKEILKITNNQFYELLQAVYRIHAIGNFLDLANIGGSEETSFEALWRDSNICEPVSSMAQILKREAIDLHRRLEEIQIAPENRE